MATDRSRSRATGGGDEAAAIEAVRADVLRRARAARAVGDYYLRARTLPAGTSLPVFEAVEVGPFQVASRPRELRLDRNSIVAFVDLEPHRNWAHACRYWIYRADANRAVRYKTVEARLPPFLTGDSNEYRRIWGAAETSSDAAPPSPASHPLRVRRRARRRPLGQRYAVLFSGATNWRHLNDLEFLYRTLLDVYEVPKDHIRVLNFDGTTSFSPAPHEPQPGGTWPGDQTGYRLVVEGKGTKQALDGVLADLKKILKEDDSLLVHTSNHGDRDYQKGSVICVKEGPSYPAANFGAALRNLPAFRSLIVSMEQCAGGGFVEPILSGSPAARTTVATACGEWEESTGGPDGSPFDPFARDWISALNGRSAFGGALPHGPSIPRPRGGSAEAAFEFANAVRDPDDSPLFGKAGPRAGNSRF